MRPSPSEVMSWFAGDVSDDALATLLTVLKRDPNWRVTDLHDGGVRTLHLLYFPHGVPFDVVFARTGRGWRLSSRPPLDSDNDG